MVWDGGSSLRPHGITMELLSPSLRLRPFDVHFLNNSQCFFDGMLGNVVLRTITAGWNHLSAEYDIFLTSTHQTTGLSLRLNVRPSIRLSKPWLRICVSCRWFSWTENFDVRDYKPLQSERFTMPLTSRYLMKNWRLFYRSSEKSWKTRHSKNCSVWN